MNDLFVESFTWKKTIDFSRCVSSNRMAITEIYRVRRVRGNCSRERDRLNEIYKRGRRQTVSFITCEQLKIARFRGRAMRFLFSQIMLLTAST